jgi:hypothetical protein
MVVLGMTLGGSLFHAGRGGIRLAAHGAKQEAASCAIQTSMGGGADVLRRMRCLGVIEGSAHRRIRISELGPGFRLAA